MVRRLIIRSWLWAFAVVAGGGTVRAQFDVPNDTICVDCPFPRLADLDADGDMDLIFTVPAEDTITWRRNQGDGTFEPPVFLAVNAHHLTFELIGDADADGDIDLVGVTLLPEHQDSTVALLRNQGGSFTTEIIGTHIGTTRPLTRLADLDGDGDLDLLGSPVDASPFGEAWYRNTGGGYDRDTISFWCAQIRGPWAVLDLEGDGDLDLATYMTGSVKRVVTLWNMGGGRFGPPTWATPVYPFTLLARPATDALDVNSDGFVDLVVGGRPCISQGDGTFQLPASLSPMTYQSIGNADCEPALEAFASSTSAQAIPQLNELSINGPFYFPGDLPTPPFRSQLVQLDADERPDLLMGPINADLGPVIWRRNNAFPIPIAYDHPVDSITAGETISVVYPPLDIEDQVPGLDVLGDGDWYTGPGVIGDSLRTAQLPEGWTVITAHYMSFNSLSECESTAQDSIYIRSAVGFDTPAPPNFLVYPDPVSDILTVETGQPVPVRYRIHDQMGREMATQVLGDPRAVGSVRIDCGQLAPGTYLLAIHLDGQPHRTRPFIVVR